MNFIKKRLKIILIVLIGINLVGDVASQDEQVIQQNIYTNPSAMGNQQFINSFRDSKASKNKDKSFYFDDWQPVVVLAKDSTELRIRKANFYVPTNKLVFEKGGEVLELFPVKIDHVKFVKSIFKPFPVKLDSKKSGRTEFIESQFFEVLYDGEGIKLLRNWKIKKMRKTGNHPMGIQTELGFTYNLKERLYFIKGNDKYVSELPKSKKKFAKLFGRNKKDVKEYASKNKLNHKSSEDVVEIFTYYEINN